MTISTAAPDSELRAAGWVGRTAPLSCTATGRALLFDLDTAAIARIIVPEGLGPGRVPRRPARSTSSSSRVADERRRGWSTARNETDRGLLVPRRARSATAGGAVVAALGVSGPESRIDPVLDEVRAAVLRAASDSRPPSLGAASRSPGAIPPCPTRSPGRSIVNEYFAYLSQNLQQVLFLTQAHFLVVLIAVGIGSAISIVLGPGRLHRRARTRRATASTGSRPASARAALLITAAAAHRALAGPVRADPAADRVRASRPR